MRRLHNPVAERYERRLGLARCAIDQIPARILRHRLGERGHQPPGREIVVDVRAHADGDADAVGGGLLRVAVIVELRAGRLQA